ncbi:MAG: sugar transferase [Actinomycetota bacterium]|nr:sugar transferase [Actinomycetota bacterium]
MTSRLQPTAPTVGQHQSRADVAERPSWEHRYVLGLVVVDAVAVALASGIAYVLRFGFTGTEEVPVTSLPYALVAVLAVPLWLTITVLSGGYERRVVGLGADEYRRVLTVALRFVALVAILFYGTRVDVARGFVGTAIPLATSLTLLGRFRARKWLHARRARGHALRRVLAVGTIEAATDLTQHLGRAMHAGFTVVGVCIPSPVEVLRVDEVDVPVLGSPDDVMVALKASQADVLAVAGEGALPAGRLRTLAWELEGSGIDLIVAPSVTDVAGPRIAIRPVAGLPLLHVEEPRLSGGARLFKACSDLLLAGIASILLAPLMLAIALVVRRSSPGPALFRQERVGRNGEHFTIRKFRTMRDTAEEELDVLIHRNEHDGLLFKIRDDPRCTPVGRRLRRFSLDELPQLWNVLAGQMSLVGPRPPLPGEVERYGDDVRRRLLVKPGLTGLWQVSGRADLPWEEAVRLDLYYVDNWSPALDFLILWKTFNAVARGRGAY